MKQKSLFPIFTKKDYKLHLGDSKQLIPKLPISKTFDLVVTSPPYNIGKEYESKTDFQSYIDWQESIIDEIIPRVKDTGSICWQVGNYIPEQGQIYPLDIPLHNIFLKNKLKLRNRIVWSYGHGTHARKRFSGRYEVIMWYTKEDEYTFNLDPVRVPNKYPNKKHYSGPKKGEISSNPLGKNPSDIWDNIPNVKSNHVEKTDHPCQFPVGLIDRLVLSLTNEGDLVFDPFMGVASAGISALHLGRKFEGIELDKKYMKIAKERIKKLERNELQTRPHDKPIYQPKV